MLDKLKSIQTKYDELTQKLCDQSILNNPDIYKNIAKERASLEETYNKSKEYTDLLKDLEEAEKMAEGEKDAEMSEYLKTEIARLKEFKDKLTEELVILLTPADPMEGKNIIMEIRSGAGGDEAALFAGELYRMYLRYAEGRGWRTETLSGHVTDLGGVKEIVFSVKGDKVYSFLQFESGVHRVQRVPLTESGGRVHTSTVTVAVLAEAEEFDVEVSPNDLRIDTYRASGAGGQHVNKTDSAVRITHVPTGVVVACQDERSQHQNRDKAMRILRSKLLEQRRIEQEKAIASARKTQVGTGDRSEKIRTYNFPQSRITDHRIPFSVHNVEEVLNGYLEEIINALKEYQQQLRLKAE
ncbi:MAG: peptide chain release factor 1 [Armatimonadota bacterium]